MIRNSKSPVIDSNVAKLLQKAPLLFRKFEPDELRHFLMLGHNEVFQKDDIIIQESEELTNEAYLILDGSVSIWSEEIHLTDLGPGDFIGETFLFGNATRTATVKANKEAIVLRFNREEVLNYFRKKPERLFKVFIMNIIEIQQRKITAMNHKMIQLKRRLLRNEDQL